MIQMCDLTYRDYISYEILPERYLKTFEHSGVSVQTLLKDFKSIKEEYGELVEYNSFYSGECLQDGSIITGYCVFDDQFEAVGLLDVNCQAVRYIKEGTLQYMASE